MALNYYGLTRKKIRSLVISLTNENQSSDKPRNNIVKITCMKNRALLLATLILVQFATLAQTIELDPPEIFPAAPSASELGKFGSYPVNLSTGLPQIEIPLYTIQSGDLQIPIKLMYHASGIKVNQTSSWVGLGWSLSTGGLISLETRDTPDELEPNPYTIPDITALENSIMENPHNFKLPDVINTLQNSWVKDAYHINLPSVNGTFFLDSDLDGEVTTKFPPEEFIVFRNKTLTVNNDYLFRIIDKQGIQYFLNDTEKSRMNKTPSSGLDLHLYNTDYNSSWLLSQIISTKGDIIDYTYGTEYATILKSETHSKSHSITQNESTTTTNIEPWKITSSSSTTTSNKLQEINFPNGRVRFILGFDSQYDGVDGQDGVFLEKIIVESGNATSGYVELKTISFTYSITGDPRYFTSSNSNKYRFKLDKVTETKGPGTEKEIASFEYADMQLPAAGSYSVDYFGYFNGKANDNLIPKRFVNIDGSIEQIGKADKSIDVNKMQAGLLTDINYPTKGSTKFEYEPNSFYGKNVFVKDESVIHSMDIIGIGDGSSAPPYPCIENCDIQTEAYNFSLNESTTLFLTGDLTCDNCDITNAKYAYAIIRVYDDGQEVYSLNMNQSDLELEEIILLTPGSISITLEVYGSLVEAHILASYLKQIGNLPDENVDGFGLRIKSITNYDSNDNFLGKKMYQYNIPNTTNSSGQLVNDDKKYDRVSTYRYFHLSQCIPQLVFSDTYSYTYSSSSRAGYENNSIQYSFVTEFEKDNNGNSIGRTEYKFNVVPNQIEDINSGSIWVNQGHKRGQVLEKKIYNEQGSLLVEEKNFYSENQNKSSSREDFKMYDHASTNYVIEPGCIAAPFTLDGTKELLHTNLNINWFKKDSTNTVQYFYDANGLLSGEVNTTFDYVYSDYNQEIQTTTTQSSNLETITNNFQYAHDLNDSQLISENRISVPLVTTKTKNDQIVNNRKVKYAFSNGLYQPKEVHSKKNAEVNLNNDDDRKITFDQYTTNGKIKEYHVEEGKTTSIIWGYSEQYPIAKIENLEYSQIPTTILNNVKSLSDADYSEVDENSLRAALEGLKTDTALSEAIVTTYTYDPLIGITSISDPSGYTSYYQYDELNRLQFIKNKDKHVMEEYRYNYGQKDLIITSLGNNIPSTVSSGASLNFAADVTGGTGNFTYQWTVNNTNMNTVTSNTTGLFTVNITSNHAPNFTLTCKVTDNTTLEFVTKSIQMLVTVNYPALVVGDISASPGSYKNSMGTNVTYSLSVSGGSGNYSYQWSKTNSQSTTNLSSQTNSVSNTVNYYDCPNYTVKCIVTDTITNEIITKTKSMGFLGSCGGGPGGP